MTHRTLVVAGLAVITACAPAHRPGSPSPRESAPEQVATPAASPEIVQASKVAESSAEAIARHADSIRVSASDVTRQAAKVFGSATDSADLEVADAEGEPESTPSWDMDVESYLSQDRVEHFVRMFSGSARTRIAERLEHGTRYEPMIRQRMREGGLPEDMYYLALIESGFNPHAYSRAAAVGMWQFMTSTGRGMGLRIDWWVDERRDPIRSTSAAVRFLKGLREQFGSLYLAAAAYNGGPGRVARGLKRFEDELEGQEGEDLFFALAEQDYLHKETKDYVPQLIAAALVAKDPQRYGMSFRTLEPFAYDSVVVGPESALPAIARAAGTTVAALHDLNPHLIRGMTPPRTDWTVRIPVGSRARFDSEWAGMERSQRTGLRREVARAGSTLEKIGAEHGVSSRQILAFNPGGVRRTKKGRLVAGQTVLVPTPAVAAASLVVPDPEIERYGSSASRKGSRKSAVELHVVRRGETLSEIAQKYGTSTARLQKLNRLRKPLIFPGQSLVVRGSAPETRASASAVRRGAKVTTASRRGGTASKSGARKSTTKATARKTSSKKASSKTASSKAASSKKVSSKTASSKTASSKKAAVKKSTAAKSRTTASKSARSSASKSTSSKSSSSTAKKKGAAPKSGARKN